jgi:hypothetical protein
VKGCGFTEKKVVQALLQLISIAADSASPSTLQVPPLKSP